MPIPCIVLEEMQQVKFLVCADIMELFYCKSLMKLKNIKNAHDIFQMGFLQSDIYLDKNECIIGNVPDAVL